MFLFCYECIKNKESIMSTEFNFGLNGSSTTHKVTSNQGVKTDNGVKNSTNVVPIIEKLSKEDLMKKLGLTEEQFTQIILKHPDFESLCLYTVLRLQLNYLRCLSIFGKLR